MANGNLRDRGVPCATAAASVIAELPCATAAAASQFGLCVYFIRCPAAAGGWGGAATLRVERPLKGVVALPV